MDWLAAGGILVKRERYTLGINGDDIRPAHRQFVRNFTDHPMHVPFGHGEGYGDAIPRMEQANLHVTAIGYIAAGAIANADVYIVERAPFRHSDCHFRGVLDVQNDFALYRKVAIHIQPIRCPVQKKVDTHLVRLLRDNAVPDVIEGSSPVRGAAVHDGKPRQFRSLLCLLDMQPVIGAHPAEEGTHGTLRNVLRVRVRAFARMRGKVVFRYIVEEIGVAHLAFGVHVSHPPIDVVPVVAQSGTGQIEREEHHVRNLTNLRGVARSAEIPVRPRHGFREVAD